MAQVFVPMLLAFLVAIAYYVSNRLDIQHKRYTQKMVSFSAGVSITYILLELFPLFTEQAVMISRWLFVSVLIGFSVHHLAEKSIYQRTKQHELVKKLGLEEEVFSFIYHFILGIVLVDISQQNIIDGVLFFIPILLFVFISTLSTNPHTSLFKALFLSGAMFLGTLFAAFIWVSRPLWIELALIGIVVGVLLFTIIRHHIPFGRRGRIGYFTIGFILYALIIIASWYF